jgi:hypothetical protein
MSELKANVKMLEKHFTETIGREVWVSIIQSYPFDNADIHVITVLYDIDREGPGQIRSAGRVGYETSRNSHAQERTHTVAVLIDESMELPDFSLRSIAGITVPVRDRYSPIRRLEFPDVGEFDKKQKLCCWNTEATRLLFSGDLRKKLAPKRGLTYFGSGGKLAVFYDAGVCPDSNLDSFIADANKGLSQIKAAECLVREKHDYKPKTEVQHVLDALTKQHGIRQFTRQIEARHLDTLEESKPPRDIPKVIRSKLLVFSYVPLFFSLVLLPVLWVVPLGELDNVQPQKANVLRVLGSSPFIAVMGTVFYCRNRIMRTLKSGKVFQATVTDIQETSLVIWSQRRFQATVEYMLDGEKQTGVTNVYNLSVSLAKVYCSTRKPVRILVHPTNPSYILCLEMLPHGLHW